MQKKIIVVHFFVICQFFIFFLNINFSLDLLIIKAIFFSFFSPTVYVVKYICVHTLGSIQYIVLVSLTPKNFWHLFLYTTVYIYLVSTLYILDPASCSYSRDNTFEHNHVVFYLPKLIRSNKNKYGRAVVSLNILFT